MMIPGPRRGRPSLTDSEAGAGYPLLDSELLLSRIPELSPSWRHREKPGPAPQPPGLPTSRRSQHQAAHWQPGRQPGRHAKSSVRHCTGAASRYPETTGPSILQVAIRLRFRFRRRGAARDQASARRGARRRLAGVSEPPHASRVRTSLRRLAHGGGSAACRLPEAASSQSAAAVAAAETASPPPDKETNQSIQSESKRYNLLPAAPGPRFSCRPSESRPRAHSARAPMRPCPAT